MATQRYMCGYRGDPLRECRWTPLQIQKYRNRLPAPLQDRIDFIGEGPAVPFTVLTSGPPGESAAIIGARVVEARTRQGQAARFRDARLRVNGTCTGARCGDPARSTLTDCGCWRRPFAASRSVPAATTAC